MKEKTITFHVNSDEVTFGKDGMKFEIGKDVGYCQVRVLKHEDKIEVVKGRSQSKYTLKYEL